MYDDLHFLTASLPFLLTLLGVGGASLSVFIVLSTVPSLTTEVLCRCCPQLTRSHKSPVIILFGSSWQGIMWVPEQLARPGGELFSQPH